MKKYIKPELFYENFELSQSIAMCDYTIGSKTIYDCSIKKDNYENDYTDATGGFVSEDICDYEFSAYCYTNGSGKMPKIFQS